MKCREKCSEGKGPPAGHWKRIRGVYQGVPCRND